MDDTKVISENPYKNSVIVSTIKNRLERKKPVKIACLDIDATLTGDKYIINKTRQKLEDYGYATIFNTSRTEEMVMTHNAYSLSKRSGRFFRPEPLLGNKNNKKFYLKPESVEPRGLLDPYIIAGSTGTRILIQQKDRSYLPDLFYQKNMLQEAREWRKKTEAVLQYLSAKGVSFSLAHFENPDNYVNKLSEIYPPDYRIQINFTDKKEKNTFSKALRLLQIQKREHSYQLANVREIDDSNPDENRYYIFLTPYNASKQHAIDHIVDQLCQELPISRQSMFVFFAGDGLPDLEMGLQAGANIKQTVVLLSGGSCLAKNFVHKMNQYAGKRLPQVHTQKQYRSNGHYIYDLPEPIGMRHIINGSEFLNGSEAIETMYAVLDYIDERIIH